MFRGDGNIADNSKKINRWNHLKSFDHQVVNVDVALVWDQAL